MVPPGRDRLKKILAKWTFPLSILSRVLLAMVLTGGDAVIADLLTSSVVEGWSRKGDTDGNRVERSAFTYVFNRKGGRCQQTTRKGERRMW
jgi:hypothetical protein